MLDFPIVEYAL